MLFGSLLRSFQKPCCYELVMPLLLNSLRTCVVLALTPGLRSQAYHAPFITLPASRPQNPLAPDTRTQVRSQNLTLLTPCLKDKTLNPETLPETLTKPLALRIAPGKTWCYTRPSSGRQNSTTYPMANGCG